MSTDTMTFTIAQINKAVETLVKSQLQMAKSVCTMIVIAAWGANSEKSADLANTLMKNLRKGVRKDAIVAILEEKCNLAYASGTFVMFEAGQDWSVESVKEIRIAAANWESYKKAKVVGKSVDLIDELEALVEKLVKKNSEKLLDHADKLAQIQALLGELKGAALFE